MRTSTCRVQLSRRGGWRLPADAASVAYPTRWQNPFRPAARTPEANAAAVAQFCTYLIGHPALVVDARRELAGKRLACWCAPTLVCHVDAWTIALTSGDGYVQDLADFRDQLLDVGDAGRSSVVEACAADRSSS